MVYGTLPASQIKAGDFVMPPRNNGRHKEVASIASHGRNVTFTFVDASKLSTGKTDRVSVGVAWAWPPLN